MKSSRSQKWMFLFAALATVALIAPAAFAASRDSASAANPSAVVMTITATAKHAQPPALQKGDVSLYLGKERVQVADMKRGDSLFLAVLIDDSLRSDLANQWPDLKAFFMTQPKNTYIAVAYARNGVAMVAQDFTTDHALAAKALRLPLGTLSTASSPYLALDDWIKRWPDHAQRSSVILFSSGVDYFRGGPATLDPDLDTTVAHAQKRNINIWSVYAPDAVRRGRRGFSAFNWQSNLDRLSQQTGGEAYFLGLESTVDLRPYFDSIQAHLNNQYLVAFVGNGGDKGKYESVKVASEIGNVGFLKPSAVYLPAVR